MPEYRKKVGPASAFHPGSQLCQSGSGSVRSRISPALPSYGSAAGQTLTQVKARTGIMAVVV